MEYYNNILTVEAGWMIEQGLMSKTNFDKLNQRGDIQVVRRACRNTPALVAFDSMPDRYKKAVTEKVGDVRKAASVNVLEGLMEHSQKASEYFEGYMIDDDRHLPAEKRREYYANAVVLDAVKRMMDSRNAKRKALGNRATRFWDEISASVQGLDTAKWPHTLPVNARSLERKYARYVADGYESLIHKAYLNGTKNAAKVADENQKSMLVTLMSDPRNLDNAQVAKLYNMVAEQMGWKKITASAVAVWRDKCDDLIYAYRRGDGQYRANRAMQVKRSAPTRPLLFWSFDGWDVELLYQETVTAKDGTHCTTYHNRLKLEIVLDACTKYPIGFAIGERENAALIREAIRDAVRETERLFGKMYRPAQIQGDNFGKKAMMPTYATVADKVTLASVGNAKAKPIERWFSYFNKKYCQMNVNWSGVGITSRKDHQPNMKELQKHRSDFPDKEGLIRQIVSYIQAERAELETAYVAKFKAEGLQELNTAQYLMTFGESTSQRYLLQGCGIVATIGGRKMDYDCFDTRFRNHQSTRWQLRYDPEDPHYAVAVNEDESLQFVLEEKYIQPMALAERTESDAAELKRVMDFNRKNEEEKRTEVNRMRQTAWNLGGNDILGKFLVTNSKGQHKSVKDDARLAAAQVAELVEADDLDNADWRRDMY